MHKGSCLCGGVRYELDAELTEIACCHCGQCRKQSGTAFATNAPVPADKLRIVAGEQLLKGYESSPGAWRMFCGNCGSPVYKRSAATPGVVRVRIGLLDTPAGHKPDYHIFAGSKADWDEIPPGTPQYDHYKPR